MPRALLLNPWIYDFAAFDLWLKPMGLLYLAAHLRRRGYAVDLLDCLDRHHPDVLAAQSLKSPRTKAYGTGKFFRRQVPKPAVFQEIPFPYWCYGMTEEMFLRALRTTSPPDVILVTSMMTYWYPGVFRAIALARQEFPSVPIVLGGIYARLCLEHAVKWSQADLVLPEYDPAAILQHIDEITNWKHSSVPLPNSLFEVAPAFDLYPRLDYGCLLTSLGCPYHCTYCASNLLFPHFRQRNPDEVFQDILHLHTTRNIQHFAFYDDALLVRSATLFEPLMDHIITRRLPCTFHTPNGLHSRYITEPMADMMFRAGFKTVRLSLETANPARQQHTGGKVTNPEFERAVNALKRAGFQGDQMGAYLFVGLPGQALQETEDTMRYAHALGVKIHLCEFSPIPGTQEWQNLEQQEHITLDDDPLVQNNSVFLYLKARYTFERIQNLKNLSRRLNADIRSSPN